MRTIMDGLSRMDDIDVEGRRVLLRTDFNVPLRSASGGAYETVADDTRIRAALPTIEELLRRGARLVLVSHLDRPRCLDAGFSMRPVAERLAQLTGASVPLAPGVTGAAVRELTEGLAPGAMLMLENLRSAPGETRNDPRFASALAELADFYVDDAFGSADQAHASTQGVAYLLPSAAGRLMEREILALSAVVDQPARPLVAILGGTDVGDEIQLVRRFVDLADAVCIGGAMCLPFLCVVHGVGCSLWPPEDLEPGASGARGRRAVGSARAPLGVCFSARSRALTGIEPRVSGLLDAPGDHVGFDIGPDTADRYAAEIDAAATVFWSGPMGRLELPAFAGGTRTIAEAVASTSATTVVAGGETVQAMRAYGLQDHVSHLSTGGRATLKLLEGRELPGLQALRRATSRESGVDPRVARP